MWFLCAAWERQLPLPGSGLTPSLLFVVVQRVMAGLSHSVTFGTKRGEGQQCSFSFLAAVIYFVKQKTFLGTTKSAHAIITF